MSVIIELDLPAQQFELGRILGTKGEPNAILETMVPLGEQTVPFFRVQGKEIGFEDSVQGHPAVNDIDVVSSHDGETLYALDWAISDDTFFESLMESGGYMLEAQGVAEKWSFELRFQSYDALTMFQEKCSKREIPIDVRRLYNPIKPDVGPWYGLSPQQRITLTRAVEAGYYAIPREIKTGTLAAEFDISDQAVTERLRRAIRNLVSSTLFSSE